ncbi:Lactosylceramide 1,3-N-acetyl-beta-D-glucosaminyltransferase [Halotydeus destructor]|nr:Lactosylceramide 1,3-N-acetyl-beta-D-glucosaminyltransferase [Halotydeus destructor]
MTQVNAEPIALFKVHKMSLVKQCIFIVLQLSQIYVTSADHRLITKEQFDETFFVGLNKPDLCQRTSSPVMVLINSAPNYFEQRSNLRNTWIQDLKKFNIPYLFVIGKSDKAIKDAVKREDSVHHDIILAKFTDSYFNLTLKSVFELGWSRAFCPEKWLLMMDDDGMIHADNLVSFISDRDPNDKEIHCFAGYYAVERSGDSDAGYERYFIPYDVYNETVWPYRCSGIAYIVSPSSVGPLHDACLDEKTVPKLWIEDIYVTGFAALRAGVAIVGNEVKFVGEYSRRRLNDGDIDMSQIIALGNIDRNYLYLSNWKVFSQLKNQPKIMSELSHLFRL